MSILVVTEQQNGRWHKMSWEALAAGQHAAEQLQQELTACVIGGEVSGLSSDLAERPVARVYSAQHELLAGYTPDGYSTALRQVIETAQPDAVLFPHTYRTRDFAPKLAASLGRGFLSDAIALKVEDERLVFVRQFFQGKLTGDVAVGGDPPHFASVQSGAFRADSLVARDSLAPIQPVEIDLSPAEIRTKTQEPFRGSKGEVDLTSAEIIVSVGRGIKEPENIPLAQDLADALGAEIAASRPICDNGWLPLERQVGSSGQTVSPKLYLALGISGAIQHVVGMRGARTIAAINRDESAPIFEIADYGIVGDLFEVVPELTKAIKESQQG